MKLYTIMLLSVCFSCNSGKIDEFVITELEKKYDDKFEIISSHRPNEPGGENLNIAYRIASKKYPKHNFNLFLKDNKSSNYEIQSIYYPHLLMEYAFVKSVDFTDYEDFPCILEPEFHITKNDDAIKSIKNIDDAILELKNTKSAKWYITMNVLVEDIKKEEFEIEDMLINYSRLITDKISGNTKFRVFIYENSGLTKDDIKINMNQTQLIKITQKDKITEEWIFSYTDKKIAERDRPFHYCLAKKQVIKH